MQKGSGGFNQIAPGSTNIKKAKAMGVGRKTLKTRFTHTAGDSFRPGGIEKVGFLGFWGGFFFRSPYN